MTINKSQGQTLNTVGINLTEDCFSHGQFYVACSRVSQKSNIFIHSIDGKANNIVYREIL